MTIYDMENCVTNACEQLVLMSAEVATNNSTAPLALEAARVLLRQTTNDLGTLWNECQDLKTRHEIQTQSNRLWTTYDAMTDYLRAELRYQEKRH